MYIPCPPPRRHPGPSRTTGYLACARAGRSRINIYPRYFSGIWDPGDQRDRGVPVRDGRTGSECYHPSTLKWTLGQPSSLDMTCQSSRTRYCDCDFKAGEGLGGISSVPYHVSTIHAIHRDRIPLSPSSRVARGDTRSQHSVCLGRRAILCIDALLPSLSSRPKCLHISMTGPASSLATLAIDPSTLSSCVSAAQEDQLSFLTAHLPLAVWGQTTTGVPCKPIDYPCVLL